MKAHLLISFSLCASIILSATTKRLKNFLDAVKSNDISALESLARVNKRDCEKLQFIDGIRKAAEKGSLASLKILVKHPCMVVANVFLHDQLVDLARSNGHMQVFRWLFTKSGLIFSPHGTMSQIEEAMRDTDLETVKFILSLPSTFDSMVSETLAKATDKELCNWIQNCRTVLDRLKANDIQSINANSLHNQFIDFILSPQSADYSEDIIKYLVNVLHVRHRNLSVNGLERVRAQNLQYKMFKIADFLQHLIDIRNGPEYLALCDKGNAPTPEQPFPTDMALIAKIIRGKVDEIDEFESKSMDPFVKEICDSKNQM